MFKRIVYEEWMDVLPIIAFFLTFAVFAFAFVRALRMGKREADRMAHLPVDDPRAPSTTQAEDSARPA